MIYLRFIYIILKHNIFYVIFHLFTFVYTVDSFGIKFLCFSAKFPLSLETYIPFSFQTTVPPGVPVGLFEKFCCGIF